MTSLDWVRSLGSKTKRPAAFRQARAIPNEKLTEDDIPGDDADWNQWTGMPAFAASFNGFDYWGSVECLRCTPAATWGPMIFRARRPCSPRSAIECGAGCSIEVAALS
jgi:hypothetical protein